MKGGRRDRDKWRKGVSVAKEKMMDVIPKEN